MKTLIWFISWTRHTELYAEWLGKEIKNTPYPANEIQLSDLSDYDIIIYGGPIHSEEIVGYKRLKKVIPYLDKQKFIVFGVGGVPESKENTEQVISKNFSKEEQERVKFFYLRGGFDPERLSGMHRLRVNLFKFKLGRKNKDHLTDGEIELLQAYEHPDNFTDKENLKPIVDYITALENQ